MNTADDLAVRLRSTIERSVGAAIGGRPIDALIDFPNYPNVGDSAIYLGQLTLLRRLGLAPPRFVCDFRTFDPQVVARALGDGVILLSGGGSFGDLSPVAQQCREAILRCFPGHPVIQLPQSIHFRDPASLERARSALERHGDTTLFVRDHGSLHIAESALGANAHVCPDMAFCLAPLRPARGSASRPVLWLARTDSESVTPPPLAATGFVADWADEPPFALRRLNWALMGATLRYPDVRLWRMALMRTYRPLAGHRLRRGLRMLAGARVVVTDRLHGHILCLLLGIPHVILDNSYGKVSSFHRTWTADSSIAHFARSADEALELAVELARSAAGDRPGATA